MAEDTQPSPIVRNASLLLTQLQNAQGNPRRGDVDAIAESLRVSGQYRPIVVNTGLQTGRKHEVLAGNHTLAAARQLGWERIAVTLVDVDDVGARRIMLADNRTAELGGYDTDALVTALEAMPTLEGTGYAPLDLEKLAAGPEKHTVTFEVDARLDRKSVTTCPECGHVFTPTTRTEEA